MWKYEPLKQYFEDLNEEGKTIEDLTFLQIEEILGFPLPESAYVQPAWWSKGNLTQQKAWTEPGWMVESPTDAVKYNKVKFYKKIIRLHDVFVYFKCPYPHNISNKTRLENAYEQMIKQYDPSKLKDMEMAQELIELAEMRTKEIKEMYEKAVSYFNAALIRKY